MNTPGIQTVARYTGRGEHNEHASPVGTTHILLRLDPDHAASRQQMLQEVRKRLQPLRGFNVSVGQPLAHRIDHLLSGIQAQISTKVFGNNLDRLRDTANKIAKAIQKVSGVTDLYIEPQIPVPQVQIELTKQRLSEVGIPPGVLAEQLEVAIGGKTVGTILEGERSFDLFLRLGETDRASINRLQELPIRIPSGGFARLSDLANVTENGGTQPHP